MDIGDRYNLVNILDGDTGTWLHSWYRRINGETYAFLMQDGNLLVQRVYWDRIKGQVRDNVHYFPAKVMV